MLDTVEARLGASPVVFLDAIVKRLVEAMAGRGGLEAICQYLDQIHYAPELAELRRTIKANMVFFERALSKCTKDMLKRPLPVRDRDVFEALGFICPRCSCLVAYDAAPFAGNKCFKCGSALQPFYALALTGLIRKHISLSPETILMDVAYDMLAGAYVAAYKALGIVMEMAAKEFGWEQFRLTDQRLRNYMDEYYYGRMAGEQKISREEKECLQFLVRGNLARVPLEEAEKLLRLGLSVVKYGYLYEVLDANGAYSHYKNAVDEFGSLYDRLNARIALVLAGMFGGGEDRVQVVKDAREVYSPLFLVKKECWEGGELRGIVMKPWFKLPFFPKADYGALQVAYAKQGAGKTFLLSSIACHSILFKKHVVFSPLNDKSNSFTLAFMPLFDYDKRTAKLKRFLEHFLEVEPQGVPVLTLNVLRRGEKVEDVERHPPTVFDRVVEVDSPLNFKIDFNDVLSQLKEAAEFYGFSRPVGFLTVRNFDRAFHDDRKKRSCNIDVRAATNMLNRFDEWRKSHPVLDMRVVIDEISYVASVYSVLYAGDALRAGATISAFIKEFRRNRVSFDCATQRPLEILQEIRDSAANVFFREMPSHISRDRSAIDWLLQYIQLRDESLKAVVKQINNRGLLPKGFWFWYHQPEYAINVVKPSPPTFMPQDPRHSNLELVKLYEKRFGQKVLLDSWRQVEKIKAEPTGEGETRFEDMGEGGEVEVWRW